MENYQLLANAVVKQAADDYQMSLCRQDKLRKELFEVEKMISDCEEFFEGDEICLYTKLDGKELKDTLKEEVRTHRYNYKSILASHAGRTKKRRV